MSNKYLDDYPLVDTIDVALEEKTRIAKMAATTLHRLHNTVQQMRNWQKDSAKLKSNIWRMKMVLRADDKNENDNQQIDPLIVHQRTEISRLEQVNDTLENEITDLKCALTTAEEDIARITACQVEDKITRIKDELSNEKEYLNDEIVHLRKKLKDTEDNQSSFMLEQFKNKLEEFTRDDRTIEMVFVNVIGKVAEIIVDLSEKLVDVSEKLYRFKSKNENLHVKLDKLKAMLRSRNGSGEGYRKRIGELNDLAKQLKNEMDRLKVIQENTNCSESLVSVDTPNIIRHVESLMNDLKNNLKHDREAIITAGDPDYLRYMKKVADIKINLKVMSVELRRSNISLHKLSYENPMNERYLKTVSLFNDFLNEIDIDIGKLRVLPMDKYCRIGGISVAQYMSKIVEVEKTVKKSTAAITVLKQTPLPIISNNNNNAIVEFEMLIERLCDKIKDLEIFDDRLNLHERIEHLEAEIVPLRLELSERNNRISVLKHEYANVKLLSERDSKKLETAEKIIIDMSKENKSFREDMGNKNQEIELMKIETNAMRKTSQDFYHDKEKLMEEMRRMRNILQDKDKEIVNILGERDTKIGILRVEIKNLKMKLWITSDENVKLKGKIEELEKQEEHERQDKFESLKKESSGDDGDNSEYSRDHLGNFHDELKRSKTKSNDAKISMNETHEPIKHFNCTLNKAVNDKIELENMDMSNLKSNDEKSSTYRLDVQRSTSEEVLRKLERVTAENKALEGKFKHLQNERKQLKAELSELRSEKGLLDRTIVDANNKCTALQDQVNKFESERNGFRRKISEYEATTENLKFRLEGIRTKLEEITDKMEGLKAENLRFAGDVEVLSSRNIETENRVQVLSTEKNELLTRINECNETNVTLRDQLNKAETENGYLSMELSKSKVENDKMKARNALLQVTCDKRERDNKELRREHDNVRKRYNEINSEYRILDDQLKIIRMKFDTLLINIILLYNKDGDRKSCSRITNTQNYSGLLKELERTFVDTRNEIKLKEDYPDASRMSVKITRMDERENDETDFKVKSDTRASHDNKVKIKDKPKDEQKRLRAKSLKLEQANLRSENSEITMQLTSTKDEFERAIMQTETSNDDEIIGFILNKLEIVNISYRKEINNYFGYTDEPMRMFENNHASAVVNIDRLEVENIALKKEIGVLRSNVNFNLVNGEKTGIKFDRAIEEIQALKLELMNLRDEKATLRSWHETLKEELNELKSERTALKNELIATRKSNFDLRLNANDIKSINEKLKETNVELENRLQNVSTKIYNDNAVPEGSHKCVKNDLEGTLNNSMQERRTFTKENPRTISKRQHKSERISAISRLQSIRENLRYIEKLK